MSASVSYNGWAILELMGHRRLAGWVQEVEMFGTKFLRIDVPGPDAELVNPNNTESDVVAESVSGTTQFYHPSAVYCITPTVANIALAAARTNYPQPVRRWELQGPDDRDEVIVEESDDGSPPF